MTSSGKDLSGTFLQRTNNLSDVANAGSSRANLRVSALGSAKAATTANIALSGTQTIDGYAAQVGDVILCAGQIAAAMNGPWIVAAGGWTRPTDYATGSSVVGRFITIEGGSTYALTIFGLAGTANVTVDTTAQTWTQIVGASVSVPIQTFTAAGAWTYTIPQTGVYEIILVGGGAGGGGAGSATTASGISNQAGAGAGSCGAETHDLFTLPAGFVLSGTVGAKGNGGNGGAANNNTGSNGVAGSATTASGGPGPTVTLTASGGTQGGPSTGNSATAGVGADGAGITTRQANVIAAPGGAGGGGLAGASRGGLAGSGGSGGGAAAAGRGGGGGTGGSTSAGNSPAPSAGASADANGLAGGNASAPGGGGGGGGGGAPGGTGGPGGAGLDGMVIVRPVGSATVLNGVPSPNALDIRYAPSDWPSSLVNGAHRFSPSLSAYNFRGSNLRHARAKAANARANAGIFRVRFIGHSIVHGFDATVPYYQNAFPERFAKMAGAVLGRAGTGMVHMINNTYATDGRLTVVGSWTGGLGSGVYYGAYGIGSLQATGAGNTIAFTPQINVDTLKVYYVLTPGGGTFNINVDGGANQPVNSNGVEAFGTATISAGAAGVHTLNIIAPASGTATILAVEGLIGTSGIIVDKVACPGTAVETAMSAPVGVNVATSPATLFGLNPPDLTVIMYMINSPNTGSALSTFQLYAGEVTTQAKIAGDVIWMVDPSDPPSPVLAVAPFRTAIYTLADSSDFPLIDYYDMFGPAATAEGNGTLYTDGIHPLPPGHDIIADTLWSALASVFPPFAIA